MSNLIEMAQFEKVSFEQFLKDYRNLFGAENVSDDMIKKIYCGIKLPERSTDGSAGFDFFSPFSFEMEEGCDLVIPTGIRAKFLDKGYSLDLYPRSGHGFKYKMELANTVGIIDSDYYDSSNEGHIMVKLVYQGFNESSSMVFDDGALIKVIIGEGYTDTRSLLPIKLDYGDKFCQGKFTPYGVTVGDNEKFHKKRDGGFGSTD